MFCIVAKRYTLAKNCLKEWIGNQGQKVDFFGSLPYCVTFKESEPYCLDILFVRLSECLSVIPRPTAYHDWSITTKFGRQVYTCPQTRVSLFGSPSSHIFGARGKNMQNFAYFQHCESDASCHMTCFYLRFRLYGHQDGWLFLPYFCPYSPAVSTRWYKWTF